MKGLILFIILVNRFSSPAVISQSAYCDLALKESLFWLETGTEMDHG
jgi:hypothetical protein